MPIAASASILPGGRSVVHGIPAAAFASFVNTSASDLDGCQVALPGEAPTVPLSIAGGATSTFSIFVSASAPIGLDPANARIFVRFKDDAGGAHGSTSVAVQTD